MPRCAYGKLSKNYCVCVCWGGGAMSTMSIIYTVCVEPFFLNFFISAPRSMQDVSSLTKHQTRAPCSGSLES